MFISKVKGNIKKTCDVKLGQKTLIVGPNGSGKSTIVNTVELALTGRAGDIAGRTDIAREADVMSLAADGASELEAIATFDDGVVAAYRTSGSTAKAKKATGDKPSDRCHEEVLPIRTLREALLGSPTTARKYLLGKVGGNMTRDEVENLLPEPVREAWRNASASIPQSISAADTLIEVLEAAGKHQREANSAVKSSRDAAKLVSGGRGAPPSDSEVKAAKAARDTARVAYEEAAAVSNTAKILAETEAEIADLDAEGERIASQFTQTDTDLKALGRAPELNPALAHVLPAMKASCEVGECLCCGGSAPNPSEVTDLEQAIAAHATKTQRHTALTTTLDALKKQFTKLTERQEALLAKADHLRGNMSAVPDLTASREAYDHADRTLTDLKAARDAWTSVQRAESAAIEAERQAQEWKALKEACESAVAMTLDSALKTFIAKVQMGLPSTDVFDLRLRDGEREVVQFGLVRDGKLHTALSGAEWARVIAAMANACVPEGKYACLIPEERAFDPDTLTNVLEALTDCPHQVIITSPIDPTSLPKGWKLIERG